MDAFSKPLAPRVRRSANTAGLPPVAAEVSPSAQRFLAAPGPPWYRFCMASPRNLHSRVKAAARKLAARFRLAAMIGTPRSARPMWRDTAAHARDFSARYAQDLDVIVAQRIQELGIPDYQNGRPDPNAGGRWRASSPHQRDGGGVVGDQGYDCAKEMSGMRIGSRLSHGFHRSNPVTNASPNLSRSV
jgi:hypothetical protein